MNGKYFLQLIYVALMVFGVWLAKGRAEESSSLKLNSVGAEHSSIPVRDPLHR